MIYFSPSRYTDYSVHYPATPLPSPPGVPTLFLKKHLLCSPRPQPLVYLHLPQGPVQLLMAPMLSHQVVMMCCHPGTHTLATQALCFNSRSLQRASRSAPSFTGEHVRALGMVDMGCGATGVTAGGVGACSPGPGPGSRSRDRTAAGRRGSCKPWAQMSRHPHARAQVLRAHASTSFRVPFSPFARATSHLLCPAWLPVLFVRSSQGNSQWQQKGLYLRMFWFLSFPSPVIFQNNPRALLALPFNPIINRHLRADGWCAT